jgi:hypothetical protein
MADKAVFKPAVWANLRLGNNIRFSKGCVTVVIDLGGKIFYDKLFFYGRMEHGRLKPAPSPFFRLNGSRFIPDYKNTSEWKSVAKQAGIQT